jgi:hypothetical protein
MFKLPLEACFIVGEDENLDSILWVQRSFVTLTIIILSAVRVFEHFVKTRRASIL